jgi:hypothetical protein
MTKFWCLSLLLYCDHKSRSDALVLNIVVWRNKYWQYFDALICLFVVTKFKNKEFPFCCSPYLLMVSSIYQLTLYCFSLHTYLARCLLPSVDQCYSHSLCSFHCNADTKRPLEDPPGVEFLQWWGVSPLMVHCMTLARCKGFWGISQVT